MAATAVLAGYRGPWAHGWATHRGDRHRCEGELALDCELQAFTERSLRIVGWAGQGRSQPIEGQAGLVLAQLGIVHGATDAPLAILGSMLRQGTGDLMRDLARGLGDLDVRDTYSVIVMDAAGRLVACRMGLQLFTTSRREGTYVTSYMLAPDSGLIPEMEPYLVGGPVP